MKAMPYEATCNVILTFNFDRFLNVVTAKYCVGFTFYFITKCYQVC